MTPHSAKDMGNKPRDEIKCFKHKVDLRKIVDVALDNVSLCVAGVDEYGNTWVTITCNNPDQLKSFKESVQHEITSAVDVKYFNDPLAKVIDNDTLRVRIAKAGESKLHFGVYSSRQSETADVWKRTKHDDDLRGLLSSDEPVGVDLCMAGAFTFEEGTCVSIVCRRVYREPKATTPPEEIKEDYLVVKSEDALSVV